MSLMVGLSYIVPLLFRLSGAEMSAINIEVAVRNVNLGLLIAASLFPANAVNPDPIGAVAFSTLLIYAGAQGIAGIFILIVARYNILGLFPR